MSSYKSLLPDATLGAPMLEVSSSPIPNDTESAAKKVANRREIMTAIMGGLGASVLAGCCSSASGAPDEPEVQGVRQAINTTDAATIAALRQITAPASGNPTVIVVGAAAASDGGGGLFEWKVFNSPAPLDDGITVVMPLKPTGYSGLGRWVRMNTVPNIATLKAFNPSASAGMVFVNVLGLTAQRDGGGGVYFWDATSTASNNDGTVVVPTANPTTGRWRRDYSGPLNVRWFGAKGDGQTPDDGAIAAALAVGGAVYFPPGNYYVSVEFSVPSGTRVSGEGWASKIQQHTHDKNVFISGSFCTFEDLHIIGDNTIGSDFNKANGIYAAEVSNVTIANCFIEKCGWAGIMLRNCLDAAILNNRLFANSTGFAYGADIETYSGSLSSGRLLIQGNHCLSNNTMGICVDPLGWDADIIIRDNVCVTLDPSTCFEGGTWTEIAAGGSRRHGIMVGYNPNVVRGPRCVVSGNLCRNTRWTGIYRLSAPASGGAEVGPVIISNNICSSNGFDPSSGGLSGGIYIDQSGHELVDGNYIFDFQNPLADMGGITINSSHEIAIPSVISNNVIQDSLGFGISICTGAALVQVRGNTIIGSFASDIYIEPSPGANMAGHIIVNNALYRTNGNAAAIYMYQQSDNLPITVRDNEIHGIGSPNALRSNSGIFSLQGPGAVRIFGNHIGGFYYAFCSQAYFGGRLPNEVFEGNIIENCSVGFGIGTPIYWYGVVPLVNNVFVNTQVKVDNAQLEGCIPGGYVCVREGDRLIVEAASTPPSGGTWIVGDRCHFTNPVAGGSLGVVCVSASPSVVWKAFGRIDA